MAHRARRFLKQFLTALGFVMIPALGHSATYYASTTGSDNNTCTQAQNSSTPKRTINATLNCLGTAAGAGAGHTVQVAPGTYNETIYYNLPGGTSWSAPFTLKATAIGTVTLRPPVGAESCITIARPTSKYAIISGFVCDGVNALYDGIKVTDSSSGAASFIRLQDIEVKNAKRQGIFVIRSTDNQLLRLTVHDNGLADNLDNGIYIGEAAHRTLIADSLFYNNHAYGIHLYSSTALPDGCIVRNNRVYTNGTGGLVLWATNTLVYNNLVYTNHTAAGNLLGSPKSGIKVGSAANGVKLYNNTVYGQKATSDDIGIEVASGAVNTEVTNNIAYNNARGITNSGTGTTLAANLTTDPKFVNATAANFTLQAGSPAIDAGVTLSAVPYDYARVSRPQGPAYDIGGYEFASASAAFDFALATGGSQSVTQGASAINTITAALLSGNTQSVSFSASGLPTGATAAFSPMTCSPGCSTALTLTTTTSTPTGTYTITVKGTGGGVTRSTSFAVTVSAHTVFNFSVSNGGSKSVGPGASVSTTISAALVSGTSQAVSFSTSGLPTGATAAFSRTSCSPTCSTTLTLTTTTSTPTGTYTITVKGTGGGVTRTTSFTLTVTTSTFTFSLSTGGGKSVGQGASVSNIISATLVSGSAQAVSFRVSGLPAGVTAPFSPAACTPTCRTTLTLTTTASTPTGAYSITITGTGGGVTKTTSFPLTVSSSSPTPSCLQASGPLITLSGVKTSGYQNKVLAAHTKIDASTAQFLTTDWTAADLGGGTNSCFHGGEVIGQQPPATAWSAMHDLSALYLNAATTSFQLENIRMFDYGDGISMEQGETNWTLRGVYFKYMRDDCVEDDYLDSGTIDDSLFDGCYDGVSARTWGGYTGDGSNNVIVMKNSLLRLQAMDATYSGSLPNHNAFWKWDAKAPKLALYNNVFRADQDSWEGGSGAGMWMAPPPGKLADCENNIMVWLGAGPFPEPLPTTFNGKPCFTVTTDKRVWDNAVAQWKANHPTTLRDVGAPIVSLFSPGITGSTTLTGTVTLKATAVDDQEVAGVQFKLNGQPIGAEVTTEAPLSWTDRASGPTKYHLTWDSHTKPNGTYTLTVTARDASGNTKTSTGITVTISN